MSNWKINGTDISDAYGVYFKKGAHDNLMTAPEMKDYLQEDCREENGVTMYVHNPKVKARNVSIPCVMVGDDISDLWAKRDAFFSLLSSGECMLELCNHNRFYNLVYLSSDKWSRVSSLSNGSGVYVTFSVTFNETNPLDVAESNLLIMENGDNALTEGGDGIEILNNIV